MPKLPTGTVTFLFTDIEGSTRLLHELGERYADVLAEHRRLLRAAMESHGGVEVDTQGDAFFVAFGRASDALSAAEAVQRTLAGGPVRVRIGIHTGEPRVTHEGYVGIDVHRAARIMSAGHGGQILLSETTRRLAGATFILRDLGPQRLKDLTAPERLYQLGEGNFPPLKTLNQTNLPVATNPLVGRGAELKTLRELVRGGARVVTITGAGGSGKTRLALQVAADLVDEYRDGVFWVPLAGLRDPELVLPSLAHALGTKDDLATYLATRDALLLLDNFEHLLDAAAPLAELLAATHRVKALVTSRAPLRIGGEHEYPLDPLSEGDAVLLFVERARSAGRKFQSDTTVADICRRLDRLPLAIELAAARTKLLEPQALLARLEKRLPLLVGGRRDAPERQRTLRSTIGWSYDLLDERTRLSFARLAVFAAAFSVEAAEQVADADLEALAVLVELSMLKAVESDRFVMLDTIREYAVERLESLDAAVDLRRRHADWFLAFAEATVKPRLRGGEVVAMLDVLDREHDNLRAALDFFEANDDAESAVRLAGALFGFWFRRGYGGEARKRLSYAVGASTQATQARAKALNAAATIALDNGDPERAKACAEEARTIYRGLGDTAGISYATIRLAQAAADSGDPSLACALAEEGVRLVREMGDEDYVRSATHELGWMTFLAGNIPRARAIHEQNLERARGAHDRYVEAASLELLALIAIAEERIADAHTMLKESYAINRELAFSFGIGYDLDYLAAAAVARGQLDLAARLFGRADALRTEIGVTLRSADAAINERTLAVLRTRLGADGLKDASDEGRSLSIDEAVDLALADAG